MAIEIFGLDVVTVHTPDNYKNQKFGGSLLLQELKCSQVNKFSVYMAQYATWQLNCKVAHISAGQMLVANGYNGKMTMSQIAGGPMI